MNELTPVMDDNRYVAEKLGICWHECEPYSNANGEVICKKCQKKIPWQDYYYPNHDFAADPARLLREMKSKLTKAEYINWLGFIWSRNTAWGIFDTIAEPGLLLKEVRKWFEGKEKEIKMDLHRNAREAI